jgi:lactate permease
VFARVFIHSIILTLVLVAVVVVQQYLIPEIIPSPPATP